jgi:hypothetical protein
MLPKKRGGARLGAGRPPQLTDLQRLQRLQIGAAVEWCLWQRTQILFDQSLDAKYDYDGVLRENWRRIWDMPLADRRRVKPTALQDLLDENQSEIEAGGPQGLNYFPGPTKIAAGIRAPIIRSIAQAASQRWGEEFTPRMVRRCLEDYRRIKAGTDACDGIMALLNWLGVTSGAV